MGGKVTVYNDGMLKDYPFKDELGTRYSDDGKVWREKESEYDLVKVV